MTDLANLSFYILQNRIQPQPKKDLEIINKINGQIFTITKSEYEFKKIKNLHPNILFEKINSPYVNSMSRLIIKGASCYVDELLISKKYLHNLTVISHKIFSFFCLGVIFQKNKKSLFCF